MHRNARRLLRLINQMLDFRKIDTNALNLQVSNQDIISFSKEIFDAFSNIAYKCKINLNFKVDADTLECWFDMDAIEKVIYNLLSNAFKFTPENGTITLSISQTTRNKESCVNIVVADNGSGINTEHLDKIFDRFYQSNDKNYHLFDSSGIGLALTKELVDLHKGRIWVTSQAYVGTTFFVELPVGLDHLNENQIIKTAKQVELHWTDTLLDWQDEKLEQVAENKIKNKFNKCKPLAVIVEDNNDLRFYIKNQLSENYRIEEAMDGVEGIEKIIKKMPDIVISDIMMPRMDGIELCKSLKTNEQTSHIPVILLTARNSEASQMLGYETGADDYMNKPFNVKLLELRIHNLVEGRKKMREKFGQGLNFKLESVTHNSIDAKFLEKAKKLVEDNLDNSDLNLKNFAAHMNISERQLERKIKALTNQTVVEFIKTMRLYEAVKLLKKQEFSISEVAFKVGFNNPNYFTTCFNKQFNLSPTQFMEKLHD